MTANEQVSGVAVVYGYFLGGYSIIYKRLLLGTFASEAVRQLTSFSG